MDRTTSKNMWPSVKIQPNHNELRRGTWRTNVFINPLSFSGSFITVSDGLNPTRNRKKGSLSMLSARQGNLSEEKDGKWTWRTKLEIAVHDVFQSMFQGILVP